MSLTHQLDYSTFEDFVDQVELACPDPIEKPRICHSGLGS
jgi:hypothetical protein